MCSDTAESDGDRVWKSRKVFRIRDALIGAAGMSIEINHFFEWFRRNDGTMPKFKRETLTVLVLDQRGLFIFDAACPTGPMRVPSGRSAIGTGGAAAMSAYEGLAWTDPAKAVRIACKHDANSRTPVRSYHLRKPA